MAKIKKRQLDSKALVIVVVVSILVLLIFYDGVTGKAWWKGKGVGPKTYQCNDQVDNDGDGKCDFLWKNAYCKDGSVPGDPGCISKDDNDESSDCIPVCNANSDCGTNSYIGVPYCGADGNVYRDYATYTCENAGKCSAVCNGQIDSYLWQNCLGYGCSNGKCNLQEGNVTCSDGTSYAQCSATKPKYCNNGVLENNCGLCGCDSYSYCDTATNNCVPSGQTCSDGTIYGGCSSTKPKYCDNGALVDKCNTCGCETGLICQIDGSCSTTTCTDSDGGKNYMVKGLVWWFFNGNWWNGTDYCVSSGRLGELYCPGGAVTYYDCPEGSCQDGVCTNASKPTLPYCTDTDGGDFYIKGDMKFETIDGTMGGNTDSCYIYSNNVLTEYYCGSNEVGGSDEEGASVFYYCPSGCSGGQCICQNSTCTASVFDLPATFCTDSEDGINYSVKGEITYRGIGPDGRFIVGASIDVCLTNSNILREYFCTPDKEVNSVEYVCPSGCSSGRCN